MDWQAFLEDMCDRSLRLTADQRQVFLARLADENRDRSEASLAASLNLSAAAVKKHMTAIYARASYTFPSLANIKGRGKLKELRACLKQAWKQTTAPPAEDPTPNTQHPESLQESPSLTSPLPPLRPAPLKPGAPFPRVRLPDNFVPRPAALNAVKAKLLAASPRPLVVSAISGLGGLGKSVLAAALVLDPDIQHRFADGILWVTLGQNPDLQTLLGDWIRQLDKSRDAFSANTLESASRYLDTLLAERQMLLVIDDVWHAAHADGFRVGGPNCRVLVTTREAQIPGAEYYPLDLMSEAEAIALVRQKLGLQWRTDQEAEVKAFAKVLGYLPLALDLAANQVRDGLTWAELQTEFQRERRAVALGTARRTSALQLLDSAEAWEQLNEDQQRQYSLQACFNLSLQRLQPDQLQQFASLGLLPEDVNLTAPVAEVLWDLPPVQAKKRLLDLRRRSLLTDGVATLDGSSTYRVHDLMHDTARNLLETGILSPPPTPNTPHPLADAHRQFLERYRSRAADGRWDRLPNDGYSHRHLTWHMQQADWAAAVHELMAASDERGRNAWFEACDRIGQPAIFVEDVARAWALAEQAYDTDPTRAIVLQCRYALITATLNSLVANLPVGMMAEFVRRGFWPVEQAWAYVEQMQDEWQIAGAIQLLAPYLSKTLCQIAVEKARTLEIEKKQAEVWIALAKIDAACSINALNVSRVIEDKDIQAWMLYKLVKLNAADVSALLNLAREIEDEYIRTGVLKNLTEIDGTYFVEALESAQGIEDEFRQSERLIELAELEAADFFALLEAAQTIEEELCRALVLNALAKLDTADVSVLVKSARAMKTKDCRAWVLCALAKLDESYFAEALESARAIEDNYTRAWVLCVLAELDASYFSEALESVRAIGDKSSQAKLVFEDYEYKRAKMLCALAKLDESYFFEALESAQAIRDGDGLGEMLCELAQLDSADFYNLLELAPTVGTGSMRGYLLHALSEFDSADFYALLELARAVEDEHIQMFVLSTLAERNATDFSVLFKSAQVLQDDLNRALVLITLAELDTAYFSEALQSARVIKDESRRAEALGNLAKLEAADFSMLLELIQSIEDESSRAEVLSKLATTDGADFPALLELAWGIEKDFRRAKVLHELAKIDGADFSMLLAAARAIEDDSSRTRVLSELAKQDATYFSDALEAAQAIDDDSGRTWVLRELAEMDTADFSALLEATQAIEDDVSCAWVLSKLAKQNATYFSDALLAARAIEDDSSRTEVLCELARQDAADFSALLEATQAIQEKHRAKVLSALAEQNTANFSALLGAARAIKDDSSRAEVLCELTQVDNADFSALLEAARTIDVRSRALVLLALAKLDKTYFPTALAAARLTKDTHILCELAQVDAADFSALLEVVQKMEDESNRVTVLSRLTQYAPQDLLPNFWPTIFELTHKLDRARVLRACLHRLSLTTLPHADWQVYLHLLACRQRPELMEDLIVLYPAILHLGGEAAMGGVVAAMGEVCGQWK